MNQLELYKTSLETTDDVKECIGWKSENLKADGLPVPIGLADWFGLTLDNLEMQTKYLDAAKKEAISRKKTITEQIEKIKVEAAEYLDGYGIDKMEGAIVSSVTITKARPARTKTKKVFELYTDKGDMENFLIEAGLGGYNYVEEEVDEVPAKLKVNRRRVVVPEVE